LDGIALQLCKKHFVGELKSESKKRRKFILLDEVPQIDFSIIWKNYSSLGVGVGSSLKDSIHLFRTRTW
jgi:uncharacterized protein YjaZ